jgi:hypothetical protein
MRAAPRRLAAALVLAAASATAADLSGVRRGVAATGSSASDQAALRREADRGAVSPAFRLGAALGAWRNASAALAYDLAHPSGDGDDAAALAEDCFDEKSAFADLETSRAALDLSPAQGLTAAGIDDPAAPSAWLSRRSGRPVGCR